MTRWTRTLVSAKWDAYVCKPFPLLVRLAMNRIFHGSNSGEEELNMSMGLLLVLLAVPGGFVSIFLFDKYGSFLQWLRGQTKFDPLAAALPDEYFFIALSMVVTGGVALWWWDSIFPDRRDFANLVPLPIPTSSIFRANSVAVLILTCLCAIDVNAASSILFPVIVGASEPRFDGSSYTRMGAPYTLRSLMEQGRRNLFAAIQILPYWQCVPLGLPTDRAYGSRSTIRSSTWALFGRLRRTGETYTNCGPGGRVRPCTVAASGRRMGDIICSAHGEVC